MVKFLSQCSFFDNTSSMTRTICILAKWKNYLINLIIYIHTIIILEYIDKMAAKKIATVFEHVPVQVSIWVQI